MPILEFFVPQKSDSVLRFVPLGGLGEIGMNCFALEQADGILVVDCGTAFPQSDIGIDVIHPDFSWLRRERERVVGLFLTHAHEDHIGAVPYLLRELELPIWGPPHALALVRHRLAEHDYKKHDLALREALVRNRYQVGPFTVEPVRMSHSIVEASALSIQTCQGTVFHTGDFNFDLDPPDGEPTDIDRLTTIGDAGVRLLLSDSTNIDVRERRGSERQVGQALHALVEAAQHRVVIAMFASNVQRLQLIGKIAQATGRKICLLGRSLQVHIEVARRVKRLDWPSDLVVSADQVSSQRRGGVLVLAGGTQGESASALRRLASASHQLLRLETGDTVIHSARVIPGNERAVHELFCDLLRQGVQLHTYKSDPEVHTSGHASQSEQSEMIRLLRPAAFVPVHGTLHHLLAHARLARSLGISDTLVVENGTPVVVNSGGLSRGTPVNHGKVNIAFGGENLEKDTMRHRVELGRTGVVVVSAALGHDGTCVYGPRVSTRGVPNLDTEPEAVRAVERAVHECLRRKGGSTPTHLEEEVRRAARRALLDWSGTRPVVVVQLFGKEDSRWA